MGRVEDQQADLLEAYWAVLANDTGASIPPELDHAYAHVAGRLVSVLTPPKPDVAFVQRLRRTIQLQGQPTHRVSTNGGWSSARWWQSRAIAVAAALVLTFTLLGAGVYAAVSLISSTPPPASLEDLRVLAQGVDKSAGVGARVAGYGFLLENPNGDQVAEGGSYRVTALDSHGSVLAMSSGQLPIILPGQRVGIGGLLSLSSSRAVDRLHIEIESGLLVSLEAQPAFSTQAVHYEDGAQPAVTGIVINPYESDVGNVLVSALAYSDEGLIIGGGGMIVESMPANKEQTVAVPITSSQKPVRVELYAELNQLPPSVN